MSLAEFVRILGRGPGRSRSMTQSEAHDAMTLMLNGESAPEAIGALLMLLRMKGEVAEEIAGFASAAQAAMPALPEIDLDWPSYAAGRTRGAPWFLLSARLVAQAGHKVLLHGWNGIDPKVREGLDAAGIATASSPEDAHARIEQDGISYLPLESFHPALFALLDLRGVLGLRSCVNTVCRMLNPANAPASVQGVFHPSYRLLQADAAALLGWKNLSVIKGGGGEFECNPTKDINAFGLRGTERIDSTHPASFDDTRRLSNTTTRDLETVWNAPDSDGFKVEIILSTAALALETLGHKDGRALAEQLWQDRHAPKAA